MLLYFFLWRLGLQLASASQHHAELRQRLQGRELIFQLQTRDGRNARHFIVSEQGIQSHSGCHSHADLTLVFRDSRIARMALDREQRQLVFLSGVHNGDIEFIGNPALNLWLQDLLDCLDRSHLPPVLTSSEISPPSCPHNPERRDHT